MSNRKNRKNKDDKHVFFLVKEDQLKIIQIVIMTIFKSNMLITTSNLPKFKLKSFKKYTHTKIT